MTVPAAPNPRRRYVVAGVLVVVAVALGAVFGLLVSRALAGYDIEPFDANQPTTLTVGDRDLALWVSPQTAQASCTAVDETSSRDSFATRSTSMDVTKDGRSWRRVGVVQGLSGSTHTVTCSVDGADARVGHADNPRLLRYVVLGAALGGTAVLLVLTAFTLALVTALRRRPSTS